jgi:translation initiation factor 2B subunit (eIF-2B alpha/beta/delta family)
MTAEQLHGRIERLASDRQSGASELVGEVLAILTDAFQNRIPLLPLGRALVHAQPSMAPVWNAVRAALTALSLEDFTEYTLRTGRAPRSVLRHATALLADSEGKPLSFVSISFSGTVLATLRALAAAHPVHVACSDGLPAFEGRRFAAKLAEGGVAVTHYTDAALGHGLIGVDALLVGADAVSPDWFLNKSGTRMLVASAIQQGVPVYVLATRDKFLSRVIADRLQVREEAGHEVWPAPPAGVTVRNPYFEKTPIDLISAVISDAGVLGAGVVADACSAAGDDVLLDLLGSPT